MTKMYFIIFIQCRNNFRDNKDITRLTDTKEPERHRIIKIKKEKIN